MTHSHIWLTTMTGNSGGGFLNIYLHLQQNHFEINSFSLVHSQRVLLSS